MMPTPASAPRRSATQREASPLAGRGPRARALAWLLVAVAALLWFGTLGWRDLVSPDEGRYAELSRAMFASGDWITPRLNGILYFEKPPLQYWAGALAYALLGPGEFAARLWPGLAGALGVLALWWTARRVFGERIALLAACILGSTAWWIANAHFLNLDAGLAFFTTLVLCGFLWAQRDEADAAQTRAGMLLAWAAMALAVLGKGLVGVVLPGATLVVYSVLARDARVWRRMHWTEGLAVLLAIAAPWFVLVSMRNPEFARFFFVHEHFERFLTTSHRRSGPWWYFLPVLAVGMLPWTTLLPGAAARAWRRVPGRFQPGRLLLAWSCVIFVFFSASGSKLPSYILPMFPALALLAARHAAALPARRLALHLGAAALLALAVLAGASLAPALHELEKFGRGPMLLDFRRWLLGGALVLVVAWTLGAWLAWRGRATAATLAMALGALVGVQAMMLGHQSFAQVKSARMLAEAVQGEAGPTTPVYSVETYDQSLPFYLGRPVILAAWVDEFALGLSIEPERGVRDVDAFVLRWNAEVSAVAVMREELFARLQRAGLPMRPIYRDGERVAVAR